MNLSTFRVACEKSALDDVARLYPSWGDSAIQKWVIEQVRAGDYIDSKEDGFLVYKNKKHIFELIKKSKKQFNVISVSMDDNGIVVPSPKKENINSNVSKPTIGDGSIAVNLFIDRGTAIDTGILFNNKKLIVCVHAIEEAMNDHKELSTMKKSLEWIVKSLLNANLVDNSVIDKDGNESQFFGLNNCSFHVREKAESFIVVTTYVISRANYSVKNMIQSYLESELNRQRKREKSIVKQNTLQIAELELEKAELNLQSLRTRSVKVKEKCQL